MPIKYIICVFSLLISSSIFALTRDNTHNYAWLQYNANGKAEARFITEGDTCPVAYLNNKPFAMVKRATGNKHFPVLACSLELPQQPLHSIVISGFELRPPVSDPKKIVIIGDTGCRIKAGDPVQACNNPAAWPFAAIAKRASRLHPDLIVHVGDYYYREAACPKNDPGCAGSPHGDNWASWRADFFAPAANLLPAAPWIMTRGNHESCARGGLGWERLLSPFPLKNACVPHNPLYFVPFKYFTLADMDSAIAEDKHAPPALLHLYKHELKLIKNSDYANVWLVTHRPVWSFYVEKPTLNHPPGISTLTAAADAVLPSAVKLILAGHTHAFAVLNPEHTAPELVVGNSGTRLTSATHFPEHLAGFKTSPKTTLKSGIVIRQFGFALLQNKRQHWQLTLYGIHGGKLAFCKLTAGSWECRQAS